MFNKIATYVNKTSKLSYICFYFDVDGFFVVYYMYQIYNKLNQTSHFCQLSTNTSCKHLNVGIKQLWCEVHYSTGRCRFYSRNFHYLLKTIQISIQFSISTLKICGFNIQNNSNWLFLENFLFIANASN
jgi:hypothetical protein